MDDFFGSSVVFNKSEICRPPGLRQFSGGMAVAGLGSGNLRHVCK